MLFYLKVIYMNTCSEQNEAERDRERERDTERERQRERERPLISGRSAACDPAVYPVS